MINEHERELIQAGVDGELDSAGKDELEALLTNSQQARDMHADLQRLNDFLADVPDLPIPEHLHHSVLQSIKLPGPSLWQRLFSAPEGRSSMLPYGLAATAVVMLAVILVQNRSEFDTDTDYSSMVGTMAKLSDSVSGQTLDGIAFDESGAQGKVNLVLREDAYVLEFDLESEQEIQFGVDLRKQGLSFQGFAQSASELNSINYSSGIVSGQGLGRQRFVVLMNRGDKADSQVPAEIELNFSLDGDLIHKSVLNTD